MLLFSFSLYSWKTTKRNRQDALTLSKKSKLFPCGKAADIYVSEKEIAQSFEIPPSLLGDVLKKCSKTETSIT
jgi:hypothetical protein